MSWILQEKIASWACLLGSGLKLIFHWNAQLLIFLKSLIKWLTEVLTLCTMKKRDLSSAQRLAVVDRSSDSSLMSIKNNSGPSMEPWGTPALMLAQGEAWPFKTTHCFLKLRKSVIILKFLSDIPFCFNLNIRPLCQTLSNTLYISNNTALTSRLTSNNW